jgi:hypothetical protein
MAQDSITASHTKEDFRVLYIEGNAIDETIQLNELAHPK